MTLRRLLLVLTSLAVAAAAAACGAEREAGGNPTLAPAGARALVEIDGDLDSGQWRAAAELADRFPGGAKVLDWLKRIDPVAGDRIVVVALDDDDYVALTQPDDAAELRSFLAEHRLVSREIEGWTGAALSTGVLDRYQQALGRGTLSGDGRYRRASETFPDEALATAYARGDEDFEWAALALTAEEEGFRLTGRLRTGSGESQAVPQALLDEVPADALAVLAFGGGRLPVELPNLLGIDLSPIADLVAGGGVLWARSGLLVPDVTALLPGGDQERLEELVRTFTRAEPEDAQLDGRPARRLQIGPVALTYAEFDGRLVVTTGTRLGPGGGLADDGAFQDARAAAGMPERTNGFLWIDVRSVAPLLGVLGGLDPAPHGLSRNLERIASVLAFSAGEGAERELGLFVEIR